MSTEKRDSIVKKFLDKELGPAQLIRYDKNQELLPLNFLDKKLANETFWNLRTGKFPSGFSKHFVGTKVFNEKQTGNVSSILLKISQNSFPYGVYFDSGMWVMVTVNHFVYHAPWLLGGWSVTYGEHAVINALYAGNSAQRYFNHVTSETNDVSILFSIALYIPSIRLAFSAPMIGLSAISGAIIAAAPSATGIALDVLAVVWDNDFTALYESTYVNVHSGDKYMWMLYSIYYYYPSVTVLGSVVSYTCMYGYLSNMNTKTFMPKVPVVVCESFTGVAMVASISGYVKEMANNIGWNAWEYDGSYS